VHSRVVLSRCRLSLALQRRAVKRARCKALLCVAVRKQKLELPHCLYVLIYQNRVSIWISKHETSRASRAFVCF